MFVGGTTTNHMLLKTDIVIVDWIECLHIVIFVNYFGVCRLCILENVWSYGGLKVPVLCLTCLRELLPFEIQPAFSVCFGILKIGLLGEVASIISSNNLTSLSFSFSLVKLLSIKSYYFQSKLCS